MYVYEFASVTITKVTHWVVCRREIYFLTALEAQKYKGKVLAGPVSSEAALLGLQIAVFLHCTHPVFPLCVSVLGLSVCPNVLSYKYTSQVELRPTLRAPFSLNLFKGPTSPYKVKFRVTGC